MKAGDGMWRGWAGVGGWDAGWCLSLHARSCACSLFSLARMIPQKAVTRSRNEPVANGAGAAPQQPQQQRHR